jgi:hypothetical protein
LRSFVPWLGSNFVHRRGRPAQNYLSAIALIAVVTEWT